MSEGKTRTDVEPAGIPAGGLRRMGLIVLLAGLAVGGLVYALGPQDSPSGDRTLQTEYYKKQEIDSQQMWGNQGSLILEISRLFHNATTYSILIALLSALFCFACFFYASHPGDAQLTPDDGPVPVPGNPGTSKGADADNKAPPA